MNKMKLCKVCQKEIATSAKSCPHCGAKLKTSLIKKVSIGFGIIIILCIVAAMSAPKDSNTQSIPISTNTPSIKKEDPKPTWNTKETDAMKNGNLQVAVKLLKTAGDIKSKAEAPSPAAVMKSPWNYYGKVIKINGTVAVAQDFPPGSNYSKTLNSENSSDIVITTDDGTTVELLLTISSGDLKVDDTVTLYGYPIGNSDVENKIGGKDPHLFIVGNSFDKQ